MNKFLSLFAIASILSFSSCSKEEEEDPFDFPDTEVVATTVTHMTREIVTETDPDRGLVDENWSASNSESGCKGGLDVDVYALYEINQARGFASIQLVPDSTSCDLNVTFNAPFRESEIVSDYWTNWDFEFTFSELRLTEFAELRLRLNYREVEFDIDVAPIMRQVFPPDTVFVDANGVFSFSINETSTSFNLNGIDWSPDFSEGSGNVLNIDHDGSEPQLEISLSASQAITQSFLVFQFVRISSYGIPEQ
jgi:hypothetical protein